MTTAKDVAPRKEQGMPEKYARWALRMRWPIILFVTVVTVVFGYFVKDLDIRNDPDTLLPASDRYVATNSYGEQKFGMGNLMVFGVIVREGDVYQADVVNLVQEIHRKLEALPNSRAANFITLAAQKVKYMGADENGLVFKRLIPTAGISTTDPAVAKEQLAFLKEGLEENPVMGPMLLYFEDAQGKRCPYAEREARKCIAKGTFIIADYDDGVKEVYLPWVRQVRAIMDQYSQDPRVKAVGGEVLMAGEPYFLAWMLADLVNKWWLFVISLGIVIVVLWLEFQNWRGAVFPLLGVGATIIWTLGLMGFTQFKLTTMMVLTPMLLLAIGIGHSVQVTRRFMNERARTPDCDKAAEIAIGRTIIPATLSIVTDAVGFATLATVDISFYKDYAYFGMFGMLTLLLTTTTLIPLLMTVFPCTQVEAKEGGHAWEAHVGAFLTRIVTGPLRWVAVAFVVGLIVWSGYYTRILEGSWDDLMPGVERGINYSRAAFKEDSLVIRQLERLNEVMPGVISVTIPIRGKEPLKPECDAQGLPKGCHDPDTMGAQGIFNKADVMADIEKLEDWMRSHPFIGFTGSYTQYIKLVHMLLTAEPGDKPEIKHFHIPTATFLKSVDPGDERDPDGMVQLYNGLLEVMTSSGDMDAFVARNWNEGIVMGFINTMHPVEAHQVTMDIQQYIEDHKNDPGFKQVHFGFRNADTSGDTNELSKEGPSYVRPGLGGFLGATEATRDVAMDIWLESPLQTAAATFFVAWLMFRSLSVSLILIGLLFVTLFAQYGLGGYYTAMGNWSGNLAFHLIVTLSISIGLGVDYSIYMVSRLREEMQATGRDWQQSLRNTLDTTGSAVIGSVIVLLGSFIPLLATDLANTWGLGIYIIQALIIDVITALTVLPLLIYWFKVKFVFEA